MRFNRSTQFYIAKNILDSVFTTNEPLDYEKWLHFIDQNQSEFVWYEDTIAGKETIANIDKVPDGFKGRVIAGLNKITCFKEFDSKNGHYNINCSFGSENNWISIGFERTPKLEDLTIFFKMANHLGALLLVDGNQVIDEKIIESLS